jgi:aminopeptidase
MAGAACVVATCRAVSALQLPINLKTLIPLHENMPGTCAMKPGDIVTAKNGKSFFIGEGDFDGKIALADALCYAEGLNPRFVVNVGTLSKELNDTLGSAATGVFANNDSLFETLRIAGVHTGDRVWRLPLWHHFSEKLKATSSRVDLKDRHIDLGTPCTTAAFLYHFSPPCDWLHLDTYGVQRSDGHTLPYLRRGMSGRPTRTLVEFLAQLACIPPPCPPKCTPC